MVIKETLEIIIDAKDKASSKLKGLGDTLGGLGKLVGVGLGASLGVAVAGTTALAGGILALSKDAATLLPIKDSFDSIAEASGAGADAMIEALRKSANYMIKDTELMKNYSTAAQLVGDDFANQLPDAMGYLGKVAAATGQDMGFMMDSLVKGVGRMSPMILDNLGIQVDMTAAQDTYAASLGKTASELTKAEQQTALMNQVLELLAANTATMGTAVDPFQQLSTTMTNLKEQVSMSIGETVLPLVTKLAEGLAAFVGSDQFQAWLSAAMEKIGEFAQGIADFIGSDEFQAWLTEMGALMRDYVVPALAEFARFIGSEVIPAVIQITGWIAKNLIPVIIELAKWFGENIMPKIKALADAFNNTIGKALTGLKTAWDTNFGGIRDVVDNWWTHIKLVFDLFKKMLEGDWKGVGETIRKIIGNMIQNIKDIDWIALGKMIVEGIGKGIVALGAWLGDTLKNIVKAAVDVAKGFLGIESPSKLMADQVGKQMALGIGQGLEGGLRTLARNTTSGIKPVVQALTAPTTMLQPAYAGSAAAQGSGMQVVLHYSPVISFADEFELEQRLKPIIQRITKQR